MLWENSKMTTAFYEGSPSATTPCDIRITGEEIVVCYEDDGPIEYRGKDLGGGHYILACPEVGGKATLHRAPDSLFLEGFWLESGAQGMWRIELSESGSARKVSLAE